MLKALLPLLALPLAGCGWQSGRGVEVAASVVRDVTIDQVTDNLFAFHSDPWAIPGHVALGDALVDRGTTVESGVQPGINFRGIGITGLSLTGRYTQANNIKVDPITDVFPLQRLQLAYRHVVLGADEDGLQSTAAGFRQRYRELLSMSDATLLARLPDLEPSSVLFGAVACEGNPTRETRLSGVLCFNAEADTLRRQADGERPAPASDHNLAFRRRAILVLWVLASQQFAQNDSPVAPPVPVPAPGGRRLAVPAPSEGAAAPAPTSAPRASTLGRPRSGSTVIIQGGGGRASQGLFLE